jgi:very-short-patch-repair endonuclease
VKEPSPIGTNVAAFLSTLAANVQRSVDRQRDLTPQELSPAEVELAEALANAGLHPAQQYPIGQFNADFCFVEEHLVVEVDGRDFHILERDRRRDAILREQGWRTLRIPASHVRADAARVAQLVRTVVDEIQIKATR